jgi:hypothetical protein
MQLYFIVCQAKPLPDLIARHEKIRVAYIQSDWILHQTVLLVFIFHFEENVTKWLGSTAHQERMQITA